MKAQIASVPVNICAYQIAFDRSLTDALRTDLQEVDVAVSWVPAVDGRLVEPNSCRDYDQAATRMRLGRDLSPTEFGCLQSHRAAYRAFLDSGASVALVCEDDAVLVSAPSVLANLGRKTVGADPRIVVLASRSQSFVAGPRRVTKTHGGTLFQFRYVPMQTVAYLINRPAAEMALAGRTDGPADWPSWASSINFMGFYPWPFRETTRPSTVGPTEIEARARRISSVTMMSYLVARNAYGSFCEFLYREWLPRVESRVWRSGGRPRAFGDDGPWMSAFGVQEVGLVLADWSRRGARRSRIRR
jgi:hypothetical protein